MMKARFGAFSSFSNVRTTIINRYQQNDCMVGQMVVVSSHLGGQLVGMSTIDPRRTAFKLHRGFALGSCGCRFRNKITFHIPEEISNAERVTKGIKGVSTSSFSVINQNPETPSMNAESSNRRKIASQAQEDISNSHKNLNESAQHYSSCSPQQNESHAFNVSNGSDIQDDNLNNCEQDTNQVKSSEGAALQVAGRAGSELTVIAFDIETTGFKLFDDRIIEFAARDLAGGEFSTMQTLVNPERSVPIYVSNIHGIRSRMVNRSDIPKWKDVAPLIVHFVESRRKSGGPVVLVAHNGKTFDVPFIVMEFLKCSLQVPPWWRFVDTLPLAREALKASGLKRPSLRLSQLHEYYGLEYMGRAHRAMADVHMLAAVLQRLLMDLEMPETDFLERSFSVEDVLSLPRFQGKYNAAAANDTFTSTTNSINRENSVPWEEYQAHSPSFPSNSNVFIKKTPNLQHPGKFYRK